MTDNDNVGGSGKPFWMLSQELEEEHAMEVEEQAMEVDEEEREVEEEEMEDVDQEDMYVEGEEMEGAYDKTTTTSEGGTQRKKMPRKDGKDREDRLPNQLKVDRHRITHVSASGNPLVPEEFVKGYRLQLGCILRSTVPLNSKNLRSEDNAHYRTLLL
jgi:hypothetical protein